MPAEAARLLARLLHGGASSGAAAATSAALPVVATDLRRAQTILDAFLAGPAEGPDAAARADLLVLTLLQCPATPARELGNVAWQLLELGQGEPGEARVAVAKAPLPDQAIPDARPPAADRAAAEAGGGGSGHGGKSYICVPEPVRDGSSTAAVEILLPEPVDGVPYLATLLQRLLAYTAQQHATIAIPQWRSSKLDALAAELALPEALTSSPAAPQVQRLW
jgi:hypothetical protein